MTILCDALKSADPSAAQLCEAMSTGLNVSPSQFDRGEMRVDYSAIGALPITGSSDGKLDPAEIYQSYLRLMPPALPGSRPGTIFLQKFGYGRPWITDAMHSAVIAKIVEKIETASARIIATDPKADPTFIKANAILQAIREPKSSGGLGIRFSNHNLPEADVNLSIDRGFVRCSEFQTLYYAIATRTGLAAYPISIPQVDAEGNEVPHAAVMIVDAAKDTRYFADMQIASVEITSPYQAYYVDTEADMFATYLFNKSMVPGSGSMKMSRLPSIPLKSVESIAPHNALALFGLGMHYFLREEGNASLSYFRKAAAARSNFTSALAQICFLTFDANECAKARASRAQKNPQASSTDMD